MEYPSIVNIWYSGYQYSGVDVVKCNTFLDYQISYLGEIAFLQLSVATGPSMQSNAHTYVLSLL